MDISEYNEKLQSGYFDKLIAKEKELEKLNQEKLNRIRNTKEFEQTDYYKTLYWLKSLSIFREDYLKEGVTDKWLHIIFGCEFEFGFNSDTFKLEWVSDY